MKILLLGSNGQLGRELERQLSSVGSVAAFPRSALDITHHRAVTDAVLAIHPNIIVNAAAHTVVDKAETDAERANSVNAEAVANLAQIAQNNGAWLIHYLVNVDICMLTHVPMFYYVRKQSGLMTNVKCQKMYI